MNGKFSLTISVGTHRMLTKRDIRDAILNLESLLNRAHINLDQDIDGNILDRDGNKCGEWSFDSEPIPRISLV